MISGDFYQLPPVAKYESQQRLDSLYSLIHQENSGLESLKGIPKPESTPLGREFMNEGIRYMFDSRSWKQLMNAGMGVSELTQVFRQKNTEFVDMLSDIREGLVSERVMNGLTLIKKKNIVDGIKVSNNTIL